MIKLIGIAIVAAGFALRLNTLLVVAAAAIASGLAAGMSFSDVVARFGALFVENRYVTMPVVVMLPLVGLLEHHGLRERAEMLLRLARAATAGRVLLLYSLMRQITISLGIQIGGHAGMVRPLIAPMAEAAARRQANTARPEDAGTPSSDRELNPATVAAIRAHAAAAENVGNFFGEDIFVAVGAVLLMSGFFQSAHVEVSVWAMAWWGLPTAIMAFALMAWRLRLLDRTIRVRESEALSRSPEGKG